MKTLVMFLCGKLKDIFSAIILLLVATNVYAVPPGTVISNTANANFDISGVPQARTSNQVDITTTVILSPATITFLQYSPTGSGATATLASPTACSNTGLAGPFNSLPNPTYLGLGALDASNPLDLGLATSYHQGEPVFIKVEDANRNIDNSVRDTLIVTIRSTTVGDEEVLQLTETDINTGEFVGYIQSVTTPMTPNDCVLAVRTAEQIEVSYTDIYDVTDTASTAVLVDPFGIVFDSTTGSPVNGITVTLIDVSTNQPADVFGDDLVSAYPSTVVTGSNVTDAGGSTYNFGNGEYRFPSVAPGTYRIEVTAPNYQVPSSVSVVQLQTLSGAPFSLDANASYMQEFTLVVGPPLNVDIPIDPIDDLLFVTKNASKVEVAIGDFLQYEVTVANNRSLDVATNSILIDELPTGFRYQKNSMQINGVYTENINVSSDGRTLQFSMGNIPAESSITIKYVVEVSSGAVLGSAINTAYARDDLGARSNIAQAAVRVKDDLLATRSILAGSVTQNACEVDNSINYGQLAYSLTSELTGDEMIHKLTMTPDENFYNESQVLINIPRLLTYKKSSTRLNGEIYQDPIIQNNMLRFPLDASSKKQVLEFRSHISAGYSGVYELAVKVNLTEDVLANESANWLKNSYKAKDIDNGINVSINKQKSENGLLDVTSANKKGVSGVQLILEDGRYVVTDERGMYHFEGIEPGAHVIQMDPSSIPDNLEIHECVKSTRTAGAKYSQFVDIQPGLLWRANFYLKDKTANHNEVTTHLTSKIDGEQLIYQLNLNGKLDEMDNIRVSILLPSGVEYLPGSSLFNDDTAKDPSELYGTLTYKLDGTLFEGENNRLQFLATGAPHVQGELSTQAIVTYDLQDLKNQRLPSVSNTLFYQKEKTKNVQKILRSNFDSLSSELNKQGKKSLNDLISNIEKYKIKKIQVIGHTDSTLIHKRSRYLFESNQVLSEARANSVADYLKQNLDINNAQLIVQGEGDRLPVASNQTGEGRALNRRVEVLIESVEVIKSQQKEVVHAHSGTVKTMIRKQNLKMSNDKYARFKNNEPKAGSYDKQWLDNANNEFEWLLPIDNANPEIPSVNIAIKHAREYKVKVLLNGEEISALNLDKKIVSNDGQRIISRWSGVDVDEGNNDLKAIIYDRNDNEVSRADKELHIAGQPVQATLLPQYSRLVADGRNPIVLAIKMIDKWGYPARPGVVGEYKLSPEYKDAALKRELDKRPLSGLLKDSTRYHIESGGIAYIELEPSTRSGKATLDFKFIDERHQTLTAWLSAERKEWILVGLAEGTVGFNNLSGNSIGLDDHQYEDNLYEDGRLAFYGKGKVKGEWLLTLAYDSERKDRNTSERLFQTIAPDEYYTLYGDATEQQFDAASAKKLYLKLEKQQFYALFGDFNTDLTTTELSRYSRSMTGIKSEFEGEYIGFNTFAADTDQIFVRDEIQGNGTSGLYRLSNKNIIINSEKIRLETRDRFRPDDVIEEQQLSQFLDYSIDTINGTLFFKRPVQSRDENLNPIYIIADYEVVGANDKQVTAGGRVGLYSKDKRSQLGVSAVSQGDTSTKGHLIGVDAEYNLTSETKLQIEAATSKTEANDNSDKGTAYLAEIEHRSQRADANVYFRRQSASYGLEQQSGNNNGSKRYGLDARYRIKETLNINSEIFRDEVLVNDNKRSVASAEIEKTQKQYQLAAGLRYAKDEYDRKDDDTSVQATGRASRYLFNGRVQLRANTEIELSNDNSVDYPTRVLGGVDYKLNDATELFAEHEYTQGEDQDTNTTRVGTRLTPWSEATVNTSVEQQSSEDGARTFGNLGFIQGWQYSDKLRLDFSLDRSDTLRNPGGEAFNENVPLSSGTVSDDFTAGSVGANYTESNWSASSRAEYRTSDADIQRSLFVGYYREENTGFGMSLDLQAFDTDSRSGGEQSQIDLSYGVAYRPDFSAWTILNRFDLNYDKSINDVSRIRNRKAVNNLILNYTVDNKQQLATHWGVKYNLDSIDGKEFDGFTQLLGFQYIYDIHERVDLSLHGDILYSSNSNNYRYSLGPSVGLNVYKNLWLTVGYNLDGFEDDDFSQSEYTASGSYLKMRFKFDKNTILGLLKK